MSLLTLTPTQQPKTSAAAPLNLTTLLAAGGIGSNTGVEWVNSGREVLYVQQGTAASTVVVSIGTEVEGEPVTSITFAGTANDILVIGPFNADEEFQPSDLIEVTFGTPANISGVALLQNVGTY
jgi:hypothetical protein